MKLLEAKKQLREAWVDNEFGYDYDETFYVSYKDGTVRSTREASERLPQKDIIGIAFYGSNAQFEVGTIL